MFSVSWHQGKEICYCRGHVSVYLGFCFSGAKAISACDASGQGVAGLKANSFWRVVSCCACHRVSGKGIFGLYLELLFIKVLFTIIIGYH